MLDQSTARVLQYSAFDAIPLHPTSEELRGLHYFRHLISFCLHADGCPMSGYPGDDQD